VTEHEEGVYFMAVRRPHSTTAEEESKKSQQRAHTWAITLEREAMLYRARDAPSCTSSTSE
jgi:hypothetical protein